MAPPSVTLEIGGEQFPMNPTPSPPQPGASLAEPPLNLAVPAGPLPAPGSVPAVPQNGQYAGTGTATNDPLGECKSPIQIQNWFVSGSNVSFSIAAFVKGNLTSFRFFSRVWGGAGR